MKTDPGIQELSDLLDQLSPVLDSRDFVFCTFEDGSRVDLINLSPIATFSEDEGLTLVLERACADENGFSYEGVMRRITLTVHSSLQTVGLTAVVSGALAQAGISANVIAAYYHDHVFVPAACAEEALAILKGLSAA